ncbi:hypothetical protein C7C46_26535 [Streptomyces tateyamensis]|uniref:Uncharacterized protein n=1 Tax=Streptomyces tateyamensis TaxID=565073 RepID=A0A2V4MVY9_9ACTN|nr:hypothetical protein [Streptomyces tateyamensis]PYC71908.1 hypothetical protein C7C46_26535 [Streptomyces tateyamensis]
MTEFAVPGLDTPWRATWWFDDGSGGSCGAAVGAAAIRAAVAADKPTGQHAAELAVAVIRQARGVCETAVRWMYVSPEGFGGVTIWFNPGAAVNIQMAEEV